MPNPAVSTTIAPLLAFAGIAAAGPALAAPLAIGQCFTRAALPATLAGAREAEVFRYETERWDSKRRWRVVRLISASASLDTGHAIEGEIGPAGTVARFCILAQLQGLQLNDPANRAVPPAIESQGDWLWKAQTKSAADKGFYPAVSGIWLFALPYERRRPHQPFLITMNPSAGTTGMFFGWGGHAYTAAGSGATLSAAGRAMIAQDVRSSPAARTIPAFTYRPAPAPAPPAVAAWLAARGVYARDWDHVGTFGTGAQAMEALVDSAHGTRGSNNSVRFMMAVVFRQPRSYPTANDRRPISMRVSTINGSCGLGGGAYIRSSTFFVDYTARTVHGFTTDEADPENVGQSPIHRAAVNRVCQALP